MDKLLHFCQRHDCSVAGAIVAVHLLVFVLSIIIFSLWGGQPAVLSIPQFLAEIWNRWDAVHFLSIAEHGYLASQRTLIVFFPFFPFLIRLTAWLIGSYVWSALLVANVASMVGLYMFYRLARLEFGRTEAWWSLVALMLFPTAYFFNAPYTDGPFLLLAVGSFYAARRGWWPVAGLLGGLAAFTRVTGVLLFPALLVEFLLQNWRERQRWFEALWLLLIPGAFGIYLWMNYAIFGTPLAFLDVLRNHWQKSLAWPWVGIRNLWQKIGPFPYTEQGLIYGVLELMAAGLAMIGFFWSLFRLRASYVVYLGLVTLVILSTSSLASTPRYLLTAFPLFFLLGRLGRYRSVALVWLVGSISLLVLLLGRFTRTWWAY